jgi:hypothetical protein
MNHPQKPTPKEYMQACLIGLLLGGILAGCLLYATYRH